MLDPSLPLTIHEYDEWGNPNDSGVLDYIISYDPYLNIKKNQIYPSLFVTTSVLDVRVPYWQPVKWIARMREFIQNKDKIFLKIEDNMGHFGDGGRYNHIQQVSYEYAFLIHEISSSSLLSSSLLLLS